MTQTFYMVEMNYPHETAGDRAAYAAFYDGHISMLLGIDGFLSAQRFQAVHPARAPFLAVYRLRGPEVLAAEAYTSKAGRLSVAPEFRNRMTDWDRNLVQAEDAPADAPGAGCLEVPFSPEARLTVIDRLGEAPPLPAGFRPLGIVGLDRTVAGRGVRTESGARTPDATPEMRPGWIVRSFRPLHAARFPVAAGGTAARP